MAESFRLEGLDDLLNKVETLEQLQGVIGGLEAGAAHLRDVFAVYPPTKRLKRRDVYGKTFKTAKQRRWFFFALRGGLISVPYRRAFDPRSERFGESWTITSENDGLRWIIGNDSTYAEKLKGNQQSLYHKAVGWTTLQADIDKQAPYVLEQITAAVEAALDAS